MERIEVSFRFANSHLGNFFNDEPPILETRYCINSSPLKFISEEELSRFGYSFYKEMLK